MKILAVCHKTTSDLGILKNVLEERGGEIDTHLGHWDSLSDINPKEHDLVIFMGGPMGVYQADIFPYLNNEITFLKERLALEKPYFGVCLGAQLMAASLGERVYPAPKGKEIGWYNLQVNQQGNKTPLKYLDGTKTKMMEWHGDTFDLPADATLLASTNLYDNQAFSFGKKALGVQFHPEVTMHNIELWLATGYDELAIEGMTVPSLRQESLDNLKRLNEQTTLFFNEWLNEVL